MTDNLLIFYCNLIKKIDEKKNLKLKNNDKIGASTKYIHSCTSLLCTNRVLCMID